jgi:general secretion pathway protein H
LTFGIALTEACKARAEGDTNRARAAGFTLIELLVVLAILALISAMAIPRMLSGPSTTELRSAARQVAAGLRFARSEAVAKRQEARLVLDLEHQSFEVDGDTQVRALPRGVGVKLFTAQSDLVSDKIGAIRFFPDGGSNGGRVTVFAGERKYDVDVDWLTGRVAILD